MRSKQSLSRITHCKQMYLDLFKGRSCVRQIDVEGGDGWKIGAGTELMVLAKKGESSMISAADFSDVFPLMTERTARRNRGTKAALVTRSCIGTPEDDRGRVRKQHSGIGYSPNQASRVKNQHRGLSTSVFLSAGMPVLMMLAAANAILVASKKSSGERKRRRVVVR